MKINEHTTQEDINNFLKKEFNEDLFHRDLYTQCRDITLVKLVSGW